MRVSTAFSLRDSAGFLPPDDQWEAETASEGGGFLNFVVAPKLESDTTEHRADRQTRTTGFGESGGPYSALVGIVRS
jgi:hypothetical protein